MNQRKTKRQRYFGFLFLPLLLFMVFACSSDTEPSPTSIGGVVPQVFVFPSGTDKRLISDERILQDNCNGTAETSQTVTRQHTVQYTMEIGAGLTVSAEGKVGVPSVGEVSVGTEVAAHYKVGYGRQETVSRSQTVAAAPRSHIQHTIQQFEIWETGEVLIVVGDQNQRLPYSFRRDFSIEAVAPANVGCTTPPAGSIESAAILPTVEPTFPPSVNPTLPPIQPAQPTRTLCAAIVTRADVQNWATVGLTDKATTQTYINEFRDTMIAGSGFVSGFVKDDTIPVGTLIATDFGNGESEDYLSLPVNPIAHYRSWGLFEVTGSFVAPNANGGWCATIR